MKIQRLAAALGGLFLASLAGSACADEIYSNGPFVTHPGAHVSGADVSMAQDVTYPGYTAFGFNAGPDYRIADDFSIPVGHFWNVTSLVLYAYQTGAGDAPFTNARVILWEGPPEGSTSVKLFDGAAVNSLVASTPGPYRSAQSFGATQFSNTDRRVQVLSIEIPDLLLDSSNYWIDWQLTGPTGTQAVFTPPVSILGQPYTAVGGFARMRCPGGITDPQDACFNREGSWQLFENGTSPYLVDLPFKVIGTDIVDAIFFNSFEATSGN